MELKSYWVFIAGLVLLTVFVMLHKTKHLWLAPYRTNPWNSMTGGPDAIGNVEGFASEMPATFTMFGVEWCGHCRTTKPEFMKLGPKVTIGGKQVTCRYVDADQQKDTLAGYDVQGYPSIFYDEGDTRVKYEGERTKEGFEAFLASM